MITPKDNPPLTASAIKALEPRAERYELADPGCAGLRLRVEPTGRKTFVWYTRDAGKRAVVTIGSWSERAEAGCVTLAEAHRALARLRSAREDGRLLAERRGLDASAASGATVEEVAKAYFAHIGKRRATAAQVQRSLERDVLPALGSLPIAKVTPLDVRRVVEAVVSRGSPSSADHVFDDFKALLRFAVGRGDLTQNPAVSLDADALGCETQKRQRSLSDDELGPWWRALDRCAMWPSVRAALRLLLLTGVRSGELLRAKWDEFDLEARVWTVPPNHQKKSRRQRVSAQPWRVPLSDQAMVQIERLRVAAEESPFVMASQLAEDGVISEKALGHAQRRLFTGKKPILKLKTEPRPVVHDLRRSCRTGLGRLGVPPHVAERCLNHELPGIETTYDTHDYFEERKAALGRWGAHVEKLVAGETGNVIALSAKEA